MAGAPTAHPTTQAMPAAQCLALTLAALRLGADDARQEASAAGKAAWLAAWGRNNTARTRCRDPCSLHLDLWRRGDMPQRERAVRFQSGCKRVGYRAPIESRRRCERELGRQAICVRGREELEPRRWAGPHRCRDSQRRDSEHQTAGGGNELRGSRARGGQSGARVGQGRAEGGGGGERLRGCAPRVLAWGAREA
eukprot:3174468-Rhodomonas_salina.1